ncbi:GntR family transcriptional regulator [Enemella evansiae]|uniref:aminotransferase-like domain-containing protein n=1 Tax=Enemella evansiae TaxID=2016499 RepID=UPI000B95EDD3|nr:PLP-dependent aminotransferase family protein [Enemella evansiae]OYO11913.1 GntR family transcriptional regulator [Enemella evansiae]
MNDDSTARLAGTLRRWVDASAPGMRLPSTRQLVAEHQVSPATVQKAVRSLVAAGVVETRPGVGNFVREVRRLASSDFGWQTGALGEAAPREPQRTSSLASAPPEAIALHSGYPDRELLPERLVRAAFTRAARNDAVVQRPPEAGTDELRAWFARELASVTGDGIAAPVARDALVLPGSQSALSASFRALVGVGGTLLIESPTYWGAILAARQAGIRLIPIPTGPEGIDADELERALRRTGARVLYAQPTFTNPTGALWSADLRDRVLELVRRHGAFLIEDDWARDFGMVPAPVPLAAQDGDGHVIHLRSLTKSVSPAVRVAGVIARGPVRERILATTRAESMYVSGVLQAVAHDVVSQSGWRTHRRGLGRQLIARRDALIAALAMEAPAVQVQGVPAGGLNLWIRLPDVVDAARLARDCRADGLLLGPGVEWFPGEEPGNFLRLNFSGPDPGGFTTGARILAAALARQGVTD